MTKVRSLQKLNISRHPPVPRHKHNLMIIRRIFAALLTRLLSETTCPCCRPLRTTSCNDAFGGATLAPGDIGRINACLRCAGFWHRYEASSEQRSVVWAGPLTLTIQTPALKQPYLHISELALINFYILCLTFRRTVTIYSYISHLHSFYTCSHF